MPHPVSHWTSSPYVIVFDFGTQVMAQDVVDTVWCGSCWLVQSSRESEVPFVINSSLCGNGAEPGVNHAILEYKWRFHSREADPGYCASMVGRRQRVDTNDPPN